MQKEGRGEGDGGERSPRGRRPHLSCGFLKRCAVMWPNDANNRIDPQSRACGAVGGRKAKLEILLLKADNLL